MGGDEPGRGEAGDDQKLQGDGDATGAEMVDRRAGGDAAQRPGQHGMATRKPFCPALRCRSREIAIPNGPSSTQTMKEMSK